jgi:hypothetical protein
MRFKEAKSVMFTSSKEMPSMASSNETFSQESYNRGGLITFIAAMAFSIIFFIALLVLHPGVDLKEVAPEGAAQTDAAAPAAEAPAATEEKAQ